MRQAARNNDHINSSFKSCQWLIVLLVMTIRLTRAQYPPTLYNGQFRGFNQPDVRQLQGIGYPTAPLTYTREYPSNVQSVWSSAPIVVNDEANILEQQRQQQQQQQQRYLPINYYNNRENYAAVESEGTNSNWINNNNNNNEPPPTRAANHNYNNNNGYFYQTQPESNNQQELEQRELLAVADSRREEEQIVRIGGSRSLAHNNEYFHPVQTLQNRDFAAKYAKHFSDYLRRYPQRLQPFYNTGNSFVDK